MKAILRLWLFVMVWGLSQAAQASTTCQATPSGTLCISQVDFTRFAQTAYQAQAQSQWCWAASISMLFSYYGYSVAQPRIVAEAYGGVVNMPAVAGVVMAQALNRSWLDDAQRPFTARLHGAFDPAANVSTLDNSRLVQELDQNRPFIIGTAGHAVVATAIQYYPTPYGPNIVSIGVFDPWPGRGARGLSVLEMTPVTMGGALSFVATAEVQAGGSSLGGAIQNPFAPVAGSGGGAADLCLVVGLAVLAWAARYRSRVAKGRARHPGNA
ncbi:papain-like cysteine protease family protein [Variovorax terrae]|uniref:C39 family peptidase n=1 Tax=Variovorax terrae TaxID=2923278 RepID=A0A9X2APN7_9BURK|nr:papain-like cysteine protease family protein [Variovorax terrae]MCJ0763717.1 C39 family peptidase [Variovorax terrae]